LNKRLINADSANNLRLKIKLAGLKGDDAVAALLDKSDRDEKGFQIQGQMGQGGGKKR
jgi:twitching motility protein PilU